MKLYEKMNTEQFDIWKHIVIPFAIIICSILVWYIIFYNE